MHGVTPNRLLSYNFVSIEGNIGAGKTSLATRIAHDFNAKLILEQFEENSFLPKFYKEHLKIHFRILIITLFSPSLH
jgi:deoxyguanosine kinase